MPIEITGTVFYADCECPFCGHKFQIEDEGSAYVNEMYKLDEVACPKCNKWFNEDTEDDEDDDDYSNHDDDDDNFEDDEDDDE